MIVFQKNILFDYYKNKLQKKDIFIVERLNIHKIIKLNLIKFRNFRSKNLKNHMNILILKFCYNEYGFS